MESIQKWNHLRTSRQHQSRTSRRLRRKPNDQELANHQRTTTITLTITPMIPLQTMKRDRKEACKNNDCICRHMHRHTYIKHLERIFSISPHYITNTCFHSIFSTYQKASFFLVCFIYYYLSFRILFFLFETYFYIQILFSLLF